MDLIDKLKELYSNVQYRKPELKPAFAGPDISDAVKNDFAYFMAEEGQEQANGTQGAAPEKEKPREPCFMELFGFALITGGLALAFAYALCSMKGCELNYHNQSSIVRSK